MYLYVYLKVMGHCPLFYNKLTLGGALHQNGQPGRRAPDNQ